MHSHTRRLHQHRLLQADIVIDLVHEILAAPEELAQRALRVRRPRGRSKPYLATQVVCAVFASKTEATWGPGLDGYAVTDGHAGDGRADAGDCARGFVAHYYPGVWVDVFAYTAVVPEVNLGVSECC